MLTHEMQHDWLETSLKLGLGDGLAPNQQIMFRQVHLEICSFRSCFCVVAKNSGGNNFESQECAESGLHSDPLGCPT